MYRHHGLHKSALFEEALVEHHYSIREESRGVEFRVCATGYAACKWVDQEILPHLLYSLNILRDISGDLVA